MCFLRQKARTHPIHALLREREQLSFPSKLMGKLCTLFSLWLIIAIIIIIFIVIIMIIIVIKQSFGTAKRFGCGISTLESHSDAYTPVIRLVRFQPVTRIIFVSSRCYAKFSRYQNVV